MMVTSAATTTPQITGSTTQRNANHGSLLRQGSPPTATYWAKTYGGSGDDYAQSVQQTSDGGYIVAGYTDSFGASGWDALVLKLNSGGSVEWQKTYRGTGTDVAYAVQQTADGGYIVAGSTDSIGLGGSNFWVLRLNSAGLVEWQKTYGGSGTDVAFTIQQTVDGGYIVAGQTYSFGAGAGDVWVLKLSSTGSVTWQKTYGGSPDLSHGGQDIAYDVEQVTDGGYIITGFTTSFNSYGTDTWVLKLNSTGSVMWQKTYGGGFLTNVIARSIQQTADGGYILAGYTIPIPTNFDAWALKLNSTGSVMWQKTYRGSGDDQALSVQQTADGGYIVAGLTDSFGAGGYDVWVFKLNSTGGIAWQKTYGGSGDEYAFSTGQTSYGGYVVAGYTDSFGAGGFDFWVVKLGAEGDIVWNAGSGASTRTTNVTPVDPSFTTSTTSITPANSTATTISTAATSQNTSATVRIQSSWDTTPPATILDLAAGSPAATSITLTWTAPGDDWMSGNATGYVVKYSTSGFINAANWGSATTYTQTWTPVENGTMETRTVSGLKNATTYWFAVEAYDGAQNYGGVSNSPSGTTLSPPGPTPPGPTIDPVIVIAGALALVVVLAVAVIVMKKRKK